MSARHHYRAMPVIYRQADQVREQFFRARGDREINPVARDHFRNLFGCALVQMQAHLGIFAAKCADHLGQHVARLSMRGGDRQGSAVGLAQLGGGAPNILHLAQNAAGP